MHYSWEEHRNLAATVAATSNDNLGTALALMGIGCLILSRDLLLASQAKLQDAAGESSSLSPNRLDN